jgi:tetratricopeptide (TPR) repeat protein
MAARQGAWNDRLIGLLVFAGVLIVYVVTLCPTVYPGESFDAVAAVTKSAFIKSVNYPVWQFAGRIFAAFTDNKGLMLNLFSAVCGAAAIGLLYRILARFSHTRTRDELVRFRALPNLAGYAALSAALLVAFSQSFWRSSVIAGPHTFNALLLVLATHLLLCYRETRKKRYFMLYGVVYALGLATFPTMLLLLPVFIVLSILWAREVYSDPITLTVTLVVSAVLFGVSSLSGPLGFSSNLPRYFLSPLPVSRTMFAYLTWYWSEIRQALPGPGVLTVLFWLLWLVLPTVPPVIYLAFTRPQRGLQIGRGTMLTAAVLKFLMGLYTIVGIVALYDFAIGPYAMVKGQGPFGTVVTYESFVVAYMVIGGWLCYLLGYWAVMLTGKAATTAASGAPRYSKNAYVFLVALFFALPAFSVVKHLQVDEPSLAGFTLFEDYAHDVLASAASAADPEVGGRAVLLVSGRDTTGDLLRYVQKYRYEADPSRQIVLADLAEADRADNTYVDKHAYMNAVLVGDGSAPVVLPADVDPARRTGLSDTEAALRYADIGSSKSGTGRSAYCLTSDLDQFDPASSQVDYVYEFVPRGLVYLLSPRDSYLNVPAEQVAKGRELWSRLRITKLKPRPLTERPAAAVMMVRRVSKLCNDFGVYCHKHAGATEATEFYKLALRFDDLNIAPLLNLEPVEGAQDPSLSRRVGKATNTLNAQVKAYVRTVLGPDAKEDAVDARTSFGTAFNIFNIYGLVRDPKYASDLRRYNPDPRARTFEFAYALTSLRILLDPEGDKLYAERGALYLVLLGQRGTLRQRIRALKDLEAALPYVEGKEKAALEYQIGDLQITLGNAKAAEETFKDVIALDPSITESVENLATPHERLADIYARTNRLDEAIRIITDRMNERPPTAQSELWRFYSRLRSYYTAKQDPQGVVAFADEYALAHPDQAYNTKLFLFDVALRDRDYDRAQQLAAELATQYDNPAAVRVRQAVLYTVQRRFADILAMPELPADLAIDPSDRIQWHDVRGQALLQQGQYIAALAEFQKAYDFAQKQEQGARGSVSARTMLGLGGHLWLAALLGAEETKNPETGQQALTYADQYRLLTRTTDTTDGDKLVADACVGWTRFKIKGEIALAVELIEPAAIGVPTVPTTKFYLGRVLIEKGEVERGIALIKESLAADLNPVDRAEAVEVLKAQGVDVSTLPTGPTETTTPAPETTPPNETGTGTQPGAETPPGNETPPGE